MATPTIMAHREDIHSPGIKELVGKNKFNQRPPMSLPLVMMRANTKPRSLP